MTSGEQFIAMQETRSKPKITINFARFWAGSSPHKLIDLILSDLVPHYDIVVSDKPQLVLYGPFQGEMPPGRYVKVFIGYENLRPLMQECDWAFGVEHEEVVRSPRYMRIARWGADKQLVHHARNWDAVMREKTRFCAFLYSNPVYYREAFFRSLSRYKPIDAPGRSMNNMASIDAVPGAHDWDTKKAFLRHYKFVVAFENSSRPGYNTEKLTHPIEADTIPIYWGDPEVGRCFNTARFINAHDYLPKPRQILPRLPYYQHALGATEVLTFPQRLARRWNGAAFEVEQRLWALPGFQALIDRIIEIDRDDALYLDYLRQPFLIGNVPPDRARWIERWRQIFTQAMTQAPY